MLPVEISFLRHYEHSSENHLSSPFGAVLAGFLLVSFCVSESQLEIGHARVIKTWNRMPVLVIHLAFPLFSYVPQDGSRVIPQDIPEIESLLSDFQLLVARSISDVPGNVI